MAVRMGGNTGGNSGGGGSSALNGLTGSPVAVIFGDSITAMATDGGSNTYNAYHGARNYFVWMMVRLGFPFYYVAGQFTTTSTLHGLGHNQGVGGDTTTQMLARISTATALNPNIVFVLAGTNDVTGGASYETITSNLTSIWQRFLARGALVVAIPILPRNSADGSSNWSNSTQRSLFLRVNSFIRDYALRTKGMMLFDPFDRLVDQTSASNNNMKTGYTVDGLHPSTTGGFWIGDKAVELFSPLFTSRPKQNFSVGDLYDATNIPFGNLISIGALTGTGGTLGAAGITGTVADSWTVERETGTTITAVASKTSKIIGNNTIVQQRIVATTPGGGASTERIRFKPTSPTITTGVANASWYEMIFDIAVSSASGGAINGIYSQLSDISTSGNTSRCMDAQAPWPDYSWDGRYITPPLLTVGTTGIRPTLEIEMDGTKAGTVTVDVNNVMVRNMQTNPESILGAR